LNPIVTPALWATAAKNKGKMMNLKSFEKVAELTLYISPTNLITFRLKAE